MKYYQQNTITSTANEWTLRMHRALRKVFRVQFHKNNACPLFLCILNILNSDRGHPCLGLAAIFAGMLYNVQIIQKSSTRNIMHVSIIVLELPAKLQWVID